MRVGRLVKTLSKEEYKEALCQVCDDIKRRSDDILYDMENNIRKIEITIRIEQGNVSMINVNKEMNAIIETNVESDKE